MNTKLTYLPEGKRRELAFVVELIREGFAEAFSRRWPKLLPLVEPFIGFAPCRASPARIASTSGFKPRLQGLPSVEPLLTQLQ